jgi:hypothetical protein
MARATGASFILLASFIGTKLLNITIPMLRPFETGIHFVATFVYFLGLLIVSNRYYHREVKIQNYILSNIGALGSGVIALFLGSVFDELGYLQGVGGTFFMLMLLDKYSEIPWEEYYMVSHYLLEHIHSISFSDFNNFDKMLFVCPF